MRKSSTNEFAKKKAEKEALEFGWHIIKAITDSAKKLNINNLDECDYIIHGAVPCAGGMIIPLYVGTKVLDDKFLRTLMTMTSYMENFT